MSLEKKRVGLGFELRAFGLLSKHSTHLSLPPVLGKRLQQTKTARSCP
jgi:hypothetical protein